MTHLVEVVSFGKDLGAGVSVNGVSGDVVEVAGEC
jgi:hypothetical protein